MTDPAHVNPAVNPAVILAAAVGAGVLVGCTDGGTPDPAPTSSPSATASDPRLTAIAAARAREVVLLAAYDDPQAGSPALVRIADDARVHHVLHLRALDAMAGVAASAAPLPSSSAAPTTDAVSGARALLAAERAAADAGIAAVGDVDDAALRRLLAEIAASEAEHATALYIGLREGLIRRTAPTPGASPS